MKITGLRTLRLAAYPRWCVVEIATDEGVIGIGETYDTAEAVEAHLHNTIAPMLLGRDPRDIEGHWNRIHRASRLTLGKSMEVRALSMVDVALWDVTARSRDEPVWRALGGGCRDRIRVYNTCAGYAYSGSHGGGYHATARGASNERPYEDLHAFLNDAGALARSLLAEGYTQMKIWPFDRFAEGGGGQYISLAQLDEGLGPFRAIRDAVGDAMEIACELHNLWSLPAAVRIAKGLEEIRPVWIEDPVPMDNIDTLARFRAESPAPVCASETVSTRWGFREMFDKGATDIAMLDVTWTGGLSEARKIGYMAEAYHLPATPHDCVGPITLMASVHLCMHLPNALVQEAVRAYVHGWYPEVVTGLPRIENGVVHAPQEPGLGIALRPELWTRPDATVRESAA
ncbi:MAG: mandelate racemase/muconate lactonizing enzyme family protein [Ectothiorhodospiraceae bacterium]|nr:mandelate racemase/muconate lactonizing enzyme family protein [Ectothiorhodospiraceae bacterium]